MFDSHKFIEMTNKLKTKISLKLRNISFVFPRNHLSEEKLIFQFKSCNIKKSNLYIIYIRVLIIKRVFDSMDRKTAL